MNPRLGWGLAAVALVVGYAGYGGRGLAFAASVTVFWLLLQLNRSIRAMKTAAGQPIGRVASAVMLQSRLKAGQPMLQVVTASRSLGRPLGGTPEQWAWVDGSGVELRIAFDDGRVASWTLARPDEAEKAEKAGNGAAGDARAVDLAGAGTSNGATR